MFFGHIFPIENIELDHFSEKVFQQNSKIEKIGLFSFLEDMEDTEDSLFNLTLVSNKIKLMNKSGNYIDELYELDVKFDEKITKTIKRNSNFKLLGVGRYFFCLKGVNTNRVFKVKKSFSDIDALRFLQISFNNTSFPQCKKYSFFQQGEACIVEELEHIISVSKKIDIWHNLYQWFFDNDEILYTEENLKKVIEDINKNLVEGEVFKLTTTEASILLEFINNNKCWDSLDFFDCNFLKRKNGDIVMNDPFNYDYLLET